MNNTIDKNNLFNSSERIKLSTAHQQIISDFSQEILKDKIKLEYISCLCGGSNFRLISDRDRYGIPQKTVLCMKCGLIFLNPRMKQEEYSKFYSSDLYRVCYDGDNYIETYRERMYNLNTGRHIFEEVIRLKPMLRDVKILELGAGGGWNLLPFIKEGADVLGLDYSQSLVGLGKKNNINMKHGSIDDIQGEYDVIIINHVLEHILNPIEALNKIKNHLAPNGIIYIGVPNILNFSMGQLQNAHVWYFSPKTLEYYCGLSGLKIVASGEAPGFHMFAIFHKVPKAECDLNKLRDHYREILSIIKKANRKERIRDFLLFFHLEGPIKALYRCVKKSCHKIS